MKKFLIKSILFLLIFLIISIWIIGYIFNNGDAFYKRFTTPRQTSLILGTSRAAQGLRPSLLNKFLGRNDIFNFSFTIEDSPFGPTYLESIKQKLNPNTKNGIFIIAVDPWSLSSPGRNPNDTNAFPEKNKVLTTVSNVNLNPNLEYIYRNFSELIFKFRQSFSVHLHEDGWLEVTVPMDSATVLERISKKIEEYKTQYLPFYHFSEKRMEYLRKTIRFLKKHGDVFLVRLPVHPEMYELDSILVPDFDGKMENLAYSEEVDFFSWMCYNRIYEYTDGNHIYKNSRQNTFGFSGDVALWIQQRIWWEENVYSKWRKK